MFLEPFDCHSWSNWPCAEPRSRTTCAGWQGSEGLMPSMQYELSCKTTQQLELRKRQANNWKTNRLIPRHGHILLHWVFPRLKVQIEDKHLPYPFLCGPCLCHCAGWNHCLHFFWLVSAKTTFLKAFITFRKTLLASFSFGPPSTIFCWPPFRVLCLLFTKECSFCSVESTFTFCSSFAFSSPHLATFKRSGLPSILVVVPCPKTRSFIINVALLTSFFVYGIFQIRLQHNFLRWRFCLCCRRVRSRGEKDSSLSFSAYRITPKNLSLQLQMYKQGHSFPRERGNLQVSLSLSISLSLSLSLWASLKSLATMNINVV